MASIPRRRKLRQRVKRPRTIADFNLLPERSQEIWAHVAQVVTDVRGGQSLKAASSEHGIDPRTVRRLAGSALRRRSSGRYAAKARDQILRVLPIPSPGGVAEIATNDSRESTELGEYWNAVQLFLDTGDSSGLERFEGQTITNTRGEKVPLLTDLDELERLGDAGVLSFESLYARTV